MIELIMTDGITLLFLVAGVAATISVMKRDS